VRLGAPDVTLSVQCLATGEFLVSGSCEDVDDCPGHSCGPYGTCVDGVGGYSCNCTAGSQEVLAGDGEKVCGSGSGCGPGACGEHGFCAFHNSGAGNASCQCAEGYEIRDVPGLCMARRCPSLSPLAHSSLNVSMELAYPASLRVACVEGYSIDGTAMSASASFSITCGADGTLSPLSSCKVIACGLPPQLPFTSRNLTEDRVIHFGEAAEYQCMDGFSRDATPSGKRIVYATCGSDGGFLVLQRCRAIVCGAPLAVIRGRSDSAGLVAFPDNVTYSCDRGYAWQVNDVFDVKVEQLQQRCLASGLFEAVPRQLLGAGGHLECQPISCGEPPAVAEAAYIRGPRRYGDGVEYRCEDNHSSDGTMRGLRHWFVKCEESGRYSPLRASSCQRILHRLEGRVSDATNLQGLAGADVVLSANGRFNTTITDSQGSFTFSEVPPGDVKLEASKHGFVTGSKALQIDADMSGGPVDLALSPLLPPDGWRAVLTWGMEPLDLDAHLLFGTQRSCHMWYRNLRVACPTGVNATLDVDDVYSYGPETTTVLNVRDSCAGTDAESDSEVCRLVFLVHNYSRRPELWSTSLASVRVFNGEAEVAEYRIDRRDGIVEGLWWAVFAIDARAGVVLPCKSVHCSA